MVGVSLPLPLGMIAADMPHSDNLGAVGVDEGGGWENKAIKHTRRRKLEVW